MTDAPATPEPPRTGYSPSALAKFAQRHPMDRVLIDALAAGREGVARVVMQERVG